ncbi:hypothetical protein ILYODFUR_034339 [Ilyodon furcidens]|uniref:Uncharacterized protein n=1 Tax=Ilyodon furcidens TaxID=33524 RepID=A0ABV0TEL3_9TELE
MVNPAYKYTHPNRAATEKPEAVKTEEQEDLCCDQNGEQPCVKQETWTILVISARKEISYSEPEPQPRTEAKEEPEPVQIKNEQEDLYFSQNGEHWWWRRQMHL